MFKNAFKKVKGKGGLYDKVDNTKKNDYHVDTDEEEANLDEATEKTNMKDTNTNDITEKSDENKEISSNDKHTNQQETIADYKNESKGVKVSISENVAVETSKNISIDTPTENIQKGGSNVTYNKQEAFTLFVKENLKLIKEENVDLDKVALKNKCLEKFNQLSKQEKIK